MSDRKQRFFTTILTLLYLFIMGIIFYVNSPFFGGKKDINFGFAVFPVISVAGCLNTILLIIVASIVIISNGRKWKLAIILQCLQLFIIIVFSLIIARNATSIPGALMILFGGVLIFLIKNYIIRITTNEEKLDKMSFTDSLTDLPNRRALMQKMRMMEKQQKIFYLIFLDLDNFKIINDTLGHDKGDELLKYVSSQWVELEKILSEFHIYRLGGDEFAILVETDNEILLYDLCSYAISCLSKKENEFSGIVTCSAGYAKFPDDTKSIDDLLTYADTAMYKAKSAGKNQLKRFDKKIFSEIVDRFNVEKDLKTNIEDEHLKLVYQGQYNIKTSELYGWEILSRMNDHNGNNIAPSQFIKTAEKSTLIYEIDKYVLDKALSETLEYYKNGGQNHISVNISGKHITSPSFSSEIKSIFDRYPDFPLDRLTIEITESSYVKNLSQAQEALSKLKEFGCSIALDDFGTGYSSLCYLSKLPIDYIKIDKSFIDKIDEDDTLIKIIIQLGHMLNLKVVAEGVETKKQFKLLQEFGCDFIQGYYYGKSKLWKDIEAGK